MMCNYESYIVLSERGQYIQVFEIMVSTKKNEEAVSPVIGVILMVAVTVILAAIIAAFVFGMAGNIQTTKVMAFTANSLANGTVQVTNMGGADSAKLSYANVTINGAAQTSSPSTTIGSSTIIGTGTAGQNKVVIVGTFKDGSTQVLFDSTV